MKQRLGQQLQKCNNLKLSNSLLTEYVSNYQSLHKNKTKHKQY